MSGRNTLFMLLIAGAFVASAVAATDAAKKSKESNDGNFFYNFLSHPMTLIGSVLSFVAVALHTLGVIAVFAIIMTIPFFLLSLLLI